MNYYPASGVSGKIKVDGEKVDLRNIELVTTEVRDVVCTPLPYTFRNGAVVVLNGKINVLGGSYYGYRPNNTDYKVWINTPYHYEWDADNGKWVSVSTLPVDGFTSGVAVVLDNEIHIFTSNSHYKWDGNTWTSVSTPPFQPKTVVVLNGEIHAISGTNHYKWDGNTWTSVSTIPYDVTYNVATALNGEIHMLCSNKIDTNDSSTAQYTYYLKWDGNTWTKLSTSPTLIFRYLSVVTLNDEIYAIARDTSYNYNAIYKWDGTAWKKLSNISTYYFDKKNFYFYVAVVYNNGIHAFGQNYTDSDNGGNIHIRARVRDYAIVVSKR